MRRITNWSPGRVPRWVRATVVGLIAFILIAALITANGRLGREAPPIADGGSAVRGVPGDVTTMPAAAATRAPGSQSPAAGSASSRPPANINVPDPNRQIIKAGTLSVVVENVDSAVQQARSVTAAHGGIVTQSSMSTGDGLGVAEFTIQVPAEQFEAAMDALRGMSGVTDRRVDKTSSQDVTEEYVDVKAQVDNLKATERQLQVLMDKATRIEDVLAIQRELTNVRGQIDRLQGRVNYLERRTAMSTIALRIAPIGSAGSRPGWRFSEALSRAWERSVAVMQGVADVLLTVAMFAVWLLPVLGLIWLAWRVATRRHGSPPAPESGVSGP